LSSITAAIQAVCRNVNAILGQTGATKISVKNYMLDKSAGVASDWAMMGQNLRDTTADVGSMPLLGSLRWLDRD
jgi:hypothetical protein